ncbi:uncharacterized protein PAE49_016291 isoform 4-T4 [Odontesthes bonariensis]
MSSESEETESESTMDPHHRLLDVTWKPEIKIITTDFQQHHFCNDERILAHQQLCDERNSSLEAPGPPQVKEEHDELCTSQMEQIIWDLKQTGCKEEEEEKEVLAAQLSCNQEKNSRLDQEEPPQIKAEQEELCTSQNEEQLLLKQETDIFMKTSNYQESDQSEPQPNSNQLLSQNFLVAERREESNHEDYGSTRNAGLKQNGH